MQSSLAIIVVNWGSGNKACEALYIFAAARSKVVQGDTLYGGVACLVGVSPVSVALHT